MARLDELLDELKKEIHALRNELGRERSLRVLAEAELRVMKGEPPNLGDLR